MKAFLPENLELEAMVNEVPPSFTFQIDNFLFLCSLINEVPSYRNEVYEEGDFVILNSQKLQAKIHNYRKYVDYLIENSIIETDNHFIIGEKSRGYRFHSNYRVPLKVVELSRKALVKDSKEAAAYDFQMQNKYDYLWKWFNPKLTIDVNAALSFIKKRYRDEIAEGNVSALRKFNSAFISIHKIASNEYRMNVDTTAGRLHTNLTSLKSDLRNFLKYDGQELVSIDIKNSQPCFSGVLFNPQFYKHKSVASDGLLNIFSARIAKKSEIEAKNLLTHLSLLLPSHMLVNNQLNTDNQSVTKYLELVQNGLFYEYLERGISNIQGTEITDRKTLKEIIFTSLFTSNRFIGQDKAESKRLFKRIFPDVYKIFSIIKKKDKTLLSKIFQRIEARVVLDTIAKRISKEYPDLPLFTIHDCVVVLKGYESYAANVIKEEMFRKVGMRVSVKFEYWKPETDVQSVLLAAA